MNKAILPGDPPLELTLRRSPRTRRFSLRVSRVDGRVTLSLPDWAPEAEALAFAREKAGWIRDVLSRRPASAPPADWDSLPLLGQTVPIRYAPGRAVRLAEGALVLPEAARAAPGPRIAAFLKLAARDRIGPAADSFAATLGRPYRDLALRDTRSRWGSCSSDGRLMFSWRLMMAPPEVLDYVVAHEVAHLAEMNHSPAFWAVCERLFPDYRRQRAWLTRNGQRLQSIRFDG